ncbi:MAG: hypothetical protein PXZ08_01470 [Actinomycetota bacterium]|nr:hypothetical protein [Actinomycetota bacterium]
MSSTPIVTADHHVDWTLVRARGVDATTFLQGQLSCDVSILAPHELVTGLVLTPTGEVVTSAWCQHDPEGVDLVVRSESLEPMLSTLRRFLLRTRCVFEVAGAVSGPYATVGEQVRRGAPGPAEFAPGLTPHSFGRSFVARHVSFTKGCFTGQELVGRLDARGGNVPYRLVRMAGESEIEMDRLARSTGPQGERSVQGVTTAVRNGDVTALALVHRTLLGEHSHVTLDDIEVELLHDRGALDR